MDIVKMVSTVLDSRMPALDVLMDFTDSSWQQAQQHISHTLYLHEFCIEKNIMPGGDWRFSRLLVKGACLLARRTHGARGIPLLQTAKTLCPTLSDPEKIALQESIDNVESLPGFY